MTDRNIYAVEAMKVLLADTLERLRAQGPESANEPVDGAGIAAAAYVIADAMVKESE